MQTAIQIIKGRPMPPTRGGPGSAAMEYPWRTMDVGDCFEVPASKWSSPRKAQVSMAAMAGKAGKKMERKFTTRRTGETITVWRVA